MNPIPDYESLRNYVQDIVHFELDLFGYLHGYGYDAEITSLMTEDNSVHIVFGVGITKLEQQFQKRPFQFQDIIKLPSGSKVDQQLRLALVNFRLGIRHPPDTGFYCYRAIVTLMQSFSNWSTFNSSLNLEETWTDDLRHNYANLQRHGSSAFMSAAKRTEMLEHAQTAIDRFLTYIKNGKSTLDKNTHPVLR